MLTTRLFASLLLWSLALHPGTLPAQAAPVPPRQTIDPRWMSVDSATRRVTFTVIGGLTSENGGLNFNGFRDGDLTFVAPARWSVVVRYTNQDAALAHSVELIADSPRLPIRGVPPAIAGAASRNVDAGTARGAPADLFRFVATPPGNYLFFCAVPAHGASGMWIRFAIDSAATRPRMMLTPRPAPPGR